MVSAARRDPGSIATDFGTLARTEGSADRLTLIIASGSGTAPLPGRPTPKLKVAQWTNQPRRSSASRCWPNLASRPARAATPSSPQRSAAIDEQLEEALDRGTPRRAAGGGVIDQARELRRLDRCGQLLAGFGQTQLDGLVLRMVHHGA